MARPLVSLDGSAISKIGRFRPLVVVDYTSIISTTLIVVVLNSQQLGSAIVLAAGMALVCFYAVVSKRQLTFFIINNKTIIVYPIIVLISASWSEIPLVSLYFGVQFCLTILAGILIGVIATQRQLVLGIFIAMAIFVILCIISGRTGPSAAGPVLIGLTSGKDTMGYDGMTLFAAAAAVIIDSRQRYIYRFLALGLAPLGAYIATTVQSAGPMLSTVGFVPIFFGVLGLRYLNLHSRWLLVVLGTALAIFAFPSIYNLIPERAGDQILLALHKDITLTGRTAIWEKADQWIAASPEIGHGFRSFWLGGSSDSTGILHKFGGIDPRAFEIHNTFLEVLVDTGWVGLIPFLVTALLFLYYVLANAFLAPNANSSFLATMYLLIIARTPLETIIGPNGMSTVLFYACGTASIVFFMNRRLGSLQVQSARGSRFLIGSAGSAVVLTQLEQ